MSYQIKRAHDFNREQLRSSISKLIYISYGHLDEYDLIKEFFEEENIEEQLVNKSDDTYVLYLDAAIAGICLWSDNSIEYLLLDYSDQTNESANYFLSKMIEEKSHNYHEIYLECLAQHSAANELLSSYGFVLQNTCCDDVGCFNTWKLVTGLN